MMLSTLESNLKYILKKRVILQEVNKAIMEQLMSAANARESVSFIDL